MNNEPKHMSDFDLTILGLQKQNVELRRAQQEAESDYLSMQNLLCLVIRKLGNTTITSKEIEEMPKTGHLITSHDKESGGITIIFEEETSADSETAL